MKYLLCFIFIFSGLSYAQTAPTEPEKVQEVKKVETAKKSNAPTLTGKEFKFFKDKSTFIRNPFGLRDPFKRKRVSRKKSQASYGKLLEGNKFSNLPKLININLEDLRIIGVLLGSKRRAMAKLIDGEKLSDETYVLEEGMKLGENDAEIRAILPGGLVLVERIRNVYDQDEYIETVIPISTGF